MKRILFLCSMVMAVIFVHAQSSHSWNPFVNQAITSPAPLMPLEFGGKGDLSFNVGNSGSDPLPLVADQEMGLVITLSDGEPDASNPLAALGGTWLSYFNWSYDPSITTYYGTQNKDIPGSTPSDPAIGTITIKYKVTRNSSREQPSNGFNVNIQPPPYTIGNQAGDDDKASSYTYVRALDFGDAPASYGSAWHEINLIKDKFNSYYLNYVYLGHTVDPEPANQPSADAKGDDDNGAINDEDGVVWPELIPGTTVVIPVTLSIVDGDITFGTYRLNAWIDWNGDGDFLDAGERIANNIGIDYFNLGGETGVYNLSVSVPADATTSPTFARFRFGSPVSQPFNNPDDSNPVGEVEDYMIVIVCPPPATPIVGAVTQPSCLTPTGSVVLSGLPSTGSWTLTRMPGGVTYTGSGTSYTVTGLPAGTTYTFTVTNSQGCISASSANVTINAVPDGPLLGGSTSVCVGMTANVTPGTGGTWTSSNTSVATVTNSGVVTGVSAGVVTLTYMRTYDGCSSSMNFTVHAMSAAPTGMLSITNSSCIDCILQGGSIALGTVNITSGTLQFSSDGGATWSTSLPVYDQDGPVQNIYARALNVNGCSSDKVLVGSTAPGSCITPAAPAGSLAIVNSSCVNCIVQGGSIALGTVNITSGTLQFSTDVGTTWSATLPEYNQSGPAQTIYASVLGTNGCRSSITLVGTTAPGVCTPANAGPDQSVDCYSTGTATMAATGSGLWSLGAGSAGTVTINNPDSPTTTVTNFSTSGSYNLVWTTTNGCSDIAVITAGTICDCPITDNAIIQPYPDGGCTPFAGTTITGSVASPGGGTYLWEVNSGSGFVTAPGTNNQQNYLTGPLTTGTYTYQRKYTTTSGVICSTTSNSVTITVYAIPKAPVVGAITHPGCTTPTGSVVLSGLPSTGGWTLTRSPGGVTYSGSGTSYTVTALPPGTNYTFTVTNSQGCISASSANVTINGLPDAPILGGSTSVCVGMTANVTLGTGGTWVSSNPLTATVSNAGVVTGVSAGVVTLTYTRTSDGCSSTMSFTVHANPSAPIIGTITQPSCTTPTGSVVLSGLPSTGTWTLTRMPGGVTYTGSGTSHTVTGLSAGTTYTFMVTNSQGCTSASSANVTISTSPDSPVLGGSTSVCVGMTAHVTPGTGGTWSSSNSSVATVTNAGVVTGVSAGVVTLTYRRTSDGCSSSMSFTVHAIPAAPKVTVVQPGCQSAVGTITVTSPLGSGYSYSIDGTNYQTSPVFSGLTPGSYQVRVQSSAGCISAPTSVTITEVVCEEADLAITKRVSNASAVAGSEVVFTIQVINNGPSAATGVVVTDVLPAGYTLISATPSRGSWSAPRWNIGNLANGASVTLQLTARVNSGGPWMNSASVEGNEPDPVPGNNNDSDGVGTPDHADLAIEKTTTAEIPLIGSQITFKLTVTNNGPANATGIVVTDILPTGYTFVSASPSTGTWNAPYWEIPYLRAGNSVLMMMTVIVNESGNYVNIASVKGKQYDPVPGNNNDQAETRPVVPTLIIFNEYLAMCGESVLTGNILSNGDRDQLGSVLTVNTTPVTTPQHGSVTIARNGDFTYTPTAGFEGQDLAVFQVCSPLICRYDTLFVTVYQDITAIAAPDLDLCGVTEVLLKGNTYEGAVSQWKLISGPGKPLFSDPGKPVTTLSGLVKGTYQVEYSLTLAGCYDADTITITLHDAPQGSAGPDAMMCSGNSYRVEGSSASNYSSVQWTHNGKGVLTEANTLHPVYHSPIDEVGEVTLVMVLQPFGDSGCSEVIDEMVITVYPKPVIECPEQTSFTFKATPGMCGYVVDNNLLDASGVNSFCDRINLHHNYSAWGNPFTLNGAFFPVGTTVVEWWAEACGSSCHSDTCRITVTVIDEEPPVFLNCPSGEVFTVALWPGACETGAMWGIPIATDNCSGVKVTQIDGPALGTQLVAGQYLIRYLAEDASGNTAYCSFTLRVVDTEYPFLVCQPNLTVESDQGACSWKSPLNSLSPLMARSNCDIDITWKVTYPDGSAASGVNDVSGHVFPMGTSTVQYVISEKNGFQADACSFTVTVIDRQAPVILCPVAGTYKTKVGECHADVLLVPPGYVDNCGKPPKFTYVIAAPDNSRSGPFEVSSKPVTLMVGNSQIIWTATDDAGNSAVCLQQITVVADQTEIQPEAGANAVICAGNSYTLTGSSAPGGLKLEWKSNGTGSFDDPTTLHPVYTPSQADILNGRVILSLTAYSECASATDYMILTITPFPTVDAGPDISACSGAIIHFDGASAENVASVTWTTSGEGTLSGANTIHPEYTPAEGEFGQLRFILSGKGMNGCEDVTVSDTVYVSIAEPLIVTASEDRTILYNRTAPLSVTVENGSGNYFYNWEPAARVYAHNASSTETVPLTASTRFTITVTDGVTGCSGKDSVNITVTQDIDDLLVIYNAISNNGDGINDVWLIDGIDLFPDNEVLIVNRWGDKIKQYSRYGQNGVFWDGTNMNDKRVPDGTYYYVLEIKNVKTYTGWIQVKSSF